MFMAWRTFIMSQNYSITLLSLSFLSLSLSTSAAVTEETDPVAVPAPTPSVVAVPDEKANAAELWNRAMEAFSARDFKNSAKLLQEYVDQYPSSPQALDARYHLGQSYLFNRNSEKAISALLAVIEVRDK